VGKKVSRSKRKELNQRRLRSPLAAETQARPVQTEPGLASPSSQKESPPKKTSKRKASKATETPLPSVAQEERVATKSPSRSRKRPHIVAVLFALIAVAFVIAYVAQGGLRSKDELVKPEEPAAPKPTATAAAITVPLKAPSAAEPPPAAQSAEPMATPPAAMEPAAKEEPRPVEAPTAQPKEPTAQPQETTRAVPTAPSINKKKDAPARSPAPTPPRAADPYE